MRKTFFLLLAAALLFLPSGTPMRAAGPGPNYESVATRLVQNANVRPGDLVLVQGGARDLELLENLFLQARKLGAFPLVTLGSERMLRRWFDVVPSQYDRQPLEFDLKLAGLADVVINVDFIENEGFWSALPQDRLAALQRAVHATGDLMRTRSVRRLFVGNQLYPTEERARLMGVSRDELGRMFWEGLSADPAQLRATGEAVRRALIGGKELHLTHPNGTDLRARMEGRSVMVSDGAITEEDMQTGGAACQVWLPAGEVIWTPVPGSAEGKIVVDRTLFQGKEIQQLTLSFAAGRLTSMTARSGLEVLKAAYDGAGPGKELLSVLDIGINPNVRLASGAPLLNYVAAGIVTVGIADNTWAGGDNRVGPGFDFQLPGCTLKVDGRPVVEAGMIKAVRPS